MEDGYFINWNQLKPKCPQCSSTDIETLKRYKQEIRVKNDKQKRIELEEYVCNTCGYKFWKRI